MGEVLRAVFAHCPTRRCFPHRPSGSAEWPPPRETSPRTGLLRASRTTPVTERKSISHHSAHSCSICNQCREDSALIPSTSRSVCRGGPMVEAPNRGAVAFRAVSGGLLATAVTYLERAGTAELIWPASDALEKSGPGRIRPLAPPPNHPDQLPLMCRLNAVLPLLVRQPQAAPWVRDSRRRRRTRTPASPRSKARCSRQGGPGQAGCASHDRAENQTPNP